MCRRGAAGSGPRFPMIIGGWNYRGMGNRPTVRGLLELQKKVDPDILFLLETKLAKKGIEKLSYTLRMPHVVFQECDGKSGGLAMFWKHGINLRLRWMGRMHIDVDITENDGRLQVAPNGHLWRTKSRQARKHLAASPNLASTGETALDVYR